MRNFRKIILHSLLLIILVFILLILYMLPYFKSETYYYQDYNVRKSLSGTLDTLVVGSSHALRSVKPTILNENLDIKSYNLSSPLMSMYGRYVLLEKEIKRNPIKTVFIEVSYNSLTLDRKTLGFEGDLYVFGRLDNTLERINFFANAFTFDEYQKVLSDTVNRTKYTLETNTENKPSQYEEFGFIPVPTNDFSITAEKKQALLNTKSLDSIIKDNNLDYFNKMIKICKENNIRIILIVTPVTERMIIKYDNNDELFSQYANLAKINDCEYYDFNLDKKRTELYSGKTSFFDESHMSNEGAEIFSNRLAEIIKRVNDGDDVSDDFYNSYEEIKETILNQDDI